jgi:hypothetical protein
MTNLVECHSGFEYADRPTALYWHEHRLVIAEILESRRTPEGNTFRVRTQDDQEFELSYLEMQDEWRIQEL